jgi:hypothetical protein
MATSISISVSYQDFFACNLKNPANTILSGMSWLCYDLRKRMGCGREWTKNKNLPECFPIPREASFLAPRNCIPGHFCCKLSSFLLALQHVTLNMEVTTLEDFYRKMTEARLPDGINKEIGHFNVFSVDEVYQQMRERPVMPYNRRA